MEEVIKAIKSARLAVKHYLEQNNNSAPHIVPVIPPHPLQSSFLSPAEGIICSVMHESQTDIEIYRLRALDDLLGYALQFEDPRTKKKKARIAYSEKLNLCWARLILAKESMHLLLSNNDNKTNTSAAAQKLITNLIHQIPSKMSPADTVEHTAVFGAIELLLPYENHLIFRDLIENGATNLEIAKSFKIPESFIELRREDSINDIFNKAYTELDLKPILKNQ